MSILRYPKCAYLLFCQRAIKSANFETINKSRTTNKIEALTVLQFHVRAIKVISVRQNFRHTANLFF